MLQSDTRPNRGGSTKGGAALPLPRKVVLCLELSWSQGLERVPDLVRHCCLSRAREQQVAPRLTTVHGWAVPANCSCCSLWQAWCRDWKIYAIRADFKLRCALPAARALAGKLGKRRVQQCAPYHWKCMASCLQLHGRTWRSSRRGAWSRLPHLPGRGRERKLGVVRKSGRGPFSLESSRSLDFAILNSWQLRARDCNCNCSCMQPWLQLEFQRT